MKKPIFFYQVLPGGQVKLTSARRKESIRYISLSEFEKYKKSETRVFWIEKKPNDISTDFTLPPGETVHFVNHKH